MRVNYWEHLSHCEENEASDHVLGNYASYWRSGRKNTFRLGE